MSKQIAENKFNIWQTRVGKTKCSIILLLFLSSPFLSFSLSTSLFVSFFFFSLLWWTKLPKKILIVNLKKQLGAPHSSPLLYFSRNVVSSFELYRWWLLQKKGWKKDMKCDVGLSRWDLMCGRWRRIWWVVQAAQCVTAWLWDCVNLAILSHRVVRGQFILLLCVHIYEQRWFILVTVI